MIIDMHCDTFLRMYEDKKDTESFMENGYSIDIKKLQKGNVSAQCFAIFNELDNGYNTQEMYDRIDYMLNALDNFDEYVYIYNGFNSLKSDKDLKKICAVPTIEDLGPILDDITNIDKLHELGFKICSLTWNDENTLGYPNSTRKEIMSNGLKNFGIEVVERMNELNMIVDVSHLSDGGFYDVAKYSKKPFVATHSNARSITNHKRNLTDDMIKILSNAGGVMGINFCSAFLCDSGNKSKVSDMIRHIKHIRYVGGIECIAIGSDFDGIECDLEIYDASQYTILIDALRDSGFTQNEIDKITYKNALRTLKDSE